MCFSAGDSANPPGKTFLMRPSIDSWTLSQLCSSSGVTMANVPIHGHKRSSHRCCCCSVSAGCNVFNVSVGWRNDRSDGLKQVCECQSWLITYLLVTCRGSNMISTNANTSWCYFDFSLSWWTFCRWVSKINSTMPVRRTWGRAPVQVWLNIASTCPVTRLTGTSETTWPESAPTMTSDPWKSMVNYQNPNTCSDFFLHSNYK